MSSINHPNRALAEPALLSKIDKLFACGVGEYVALPQLVVVGDQSSGKSSVLEGLTKLPFPRDGGLCTRFATQIAFRRAPKSNISVSVIPAASAGRDHVEATKAWSKTNLKALDPASFSIIMQEVHHLMGLGEQDNADNKATFSQDVLRLEVSGPDEEHFSVVDVPGIFRKTTDGLTTKADRLMVEGMVRGYMENPRSVMLTVVPCNVDIATQEILTMAEEVDEDGHRTLGVLTKPDLVDQGAETSVMDLIEGKRHQLSLGWCLVRNPSQKQLCEGALDRNAIEDEFFQFQAPWNSLDKDRVGMKALRVRLQEILTVNIRREFPKVRSEIHKKLTTAKQRLDKLGPKRETAEEQRAYLLDISVRFQELTALAQSARYGGHDWFDQVPSLRLSNIIIRRNEIFNENMHQLGQSYAFEARAPVAVETVPTPEERPHLDEEARANSEPSDDQVRLRCTENHIELDEIMFTGVSITKTLRHDIINWLTEIYQCSRGFELGTFDSSLLAMTMKTQSSKWESITMTYMSDLVSMTHTFIIDLLRLICPSVRVREGLMSVLMHGLMTKYKTALDSARFLLRVERGGTPMTLNHYFNDNLEKSRQCRRQDEQPNSMSNTEHIVRDIHDILQSYYQVAQKRFVDSVCMQAADYHLITGPGTPLKLLSPSFVNSLSAEQLAELAGEEADVKMSRKKLGKAIDNLETGKKILM